MTAATIATGRGTRLSRVSEVTWGTTPTSPSFKNLRAVRSSLGGDVDVKTSQEFTTSRNVSDTYVTGKTADGTIEGEWIYGHWDDLLADSLMGSWSSNELRVGQTLKSATYEETYELGVLDQFHRLRGGVVKKATITFPPEDAGKVQFDIQARELVKASSTLSGATYTAAATTRMPSTPEQLTATWNGITATPILRSFSLTIDNNVRLRRVADSLTSVQFGLGMAEITGEAEVYFDDVGIYDEIYNQSTAGLTLTVGVTSGSKYTIAIPKIKWLGGRLSDRTRDTEIMLPMRFRALDDSASASSLVITRAVT